MENIRLVYAVSRIVVIASEGSITTRVDCLVLLMVSFVGIRPKFDFASDRFVFVSFIYDCCSLGLGSFLGRHLLCCPQM